MLNAETKIQWPGFTMLEILIVAALTMMFLGLTAVMGSQAVKNGEFDRVREAVRGELVSAQADAMAGTLDSGWGVAFSASGITRYRGASYAGRNAAFDRFTPVSNSITFSGTSDVAFTRPKGFPTAAATIVFTDGQHTATTTVNAVGMVSVQ